MVIIMIFSDKLHPSISLNWYIGRAMPSWSTSISHKESQCVAIKRWNIKIKKNFDRSRNNGRNMSFFVIAKDVIVFLFWTVIFIMKNIVNLFIPLKYKMKSIAGEITLVTGGGGGLGRLTALRLANLGAIVVIWDVNKAGKLFSFWKTLSERISD